MKKFSLAAPFLFLISGCAVQTRNSAELMELKHQIVELQKVQGTQSAKLDEINQRLTLMVTEEKNHQGASTQVSPSNLEVVLKKAEPIALMIPPPQKTTVTGVEKLYAQVLDLAKRDQLPALQKNAYLMLKGYKESPLTNNALFVLGKKYFDKGQFLKAAEEFENLYKTFPDGNKAISALYHLGLCYKKLGKPNEAEEAFQNIASVYPGSHEAKLAQNELAVEKSTGNEE